MHPNQSPKSEVSDKPDAWLVTFDEESTAVYTSEYRCEAEADIDNPRRERYGIIPLYRRATDDRVRALVEAAVDVVAQLAATGTVELKIAETLCAALADIRIGVKGEK